MTDSSFDPPPRVSRIAIAELRGQYSATPLKKPLRSPSTNHPSALNLAGELAIARPIACRDTAIEQVRHEVLNSESLHLE